MKKLLIAGSMLAALASGTTQAADDWSFSFSPYLQGTQIDGDSKIGTKLGQSIAAEVDVDFDKILRNLETAAMLHFEAQHISGWGFVADYSYMDLGKSQAMATPLPLPSGKTANINRVTADVRQGVLELMGTYRQDLGANAYFDTYAGIRWWDNDIKVDIDYTVDTTDTRLHKEVTPDWVDLVVGARYFRPINEEWKFIATADVGGFGLESDFTAAVTVGTQYQINDSMLLDLKYKATWVDYKTGSEGNNNHFEYDTVTFGPVAGLTMNF